ncbi:hypothetical protein H2203_007350 [Taxawa tesnikishii (nom. ined.)]|nr:hypothetical protein H2203_007350 [Dothideales sp. JES 119]
MVELLIREGARIDGTDGNGWTPLQLAAAGRRNNVVRILLDHGAGFKSGQYSMANGSVDADEERFAKTMVLFSGWPTKLFDCVKAKEWEQAKRLIEVGCDIEVRDEDGRTALQLAIESNHAEITSCLLALGADVNCLTTKNEAPLLYAVSSFCGVRKPLAVRAKIHTLGTSRRIALRYADRANQANQRQIVKMFSDAGADPCVPSSENWPNMLCLQRTMALNGKLLDE